MDRTLQILYHPIEYDGARRRLWVLGQRCHHGATGALIALAGTVGLAAGGRHPIRGAAVAAGGLLMVHDWKDRSIWFVPGHGTQP
ncbi:MAG TPA: hypothetical protein VHX88_18200 [Solirubrobacteraceae bacterium]|jgi:hypothetical protein|nr:hypothetical protein [Solirubrobacteraceae bacterium]